MHLGCQKHVEDYVGDVNIFLGENDPPPLVPVRFIYNIMQEYYSKCLKDFLLRIPKSIVNGSQIHLALAHWK
jgi:hypothetical protein